MCVKGWRLLGRIELGQEAVDVSQPLGAVRVLEALVLGQHVDETLADFVTVLAQQVAPAITKTLDDVVDAALRRERLRHAAVPGRVAPVAAAAEVVVAPP